MSQRIVILTLGGLVLLLVGLLAGQNLERSRALDGLPFASPRSAAAAGGIASAPGRAQAPLSTTEYWITPPETDANRTGFSAWAVLRPGGNFVLERCRAPDYANEAGAPRLPVTRCEPIMDGLILQLNEHQLVVGAKDGSSRTFRYSLARNGPTQDLVLDFGETVKLVPGSKNSLFTRLQQLPSDEEARNRYLRNMVRSRVAGAPVARNKSD